MRRISLICMMVWGVAALIPLQPQKAPAASEVEALPESAVSYHPCKIPGYLSIAKLPFFPVIELALKRLP